MSALNLTNSRQPVASAFIPHVSGLLQRKCACGGNAGLDGACEECRKKRLIGPNSENSLAQNSFLSGESQCSPTWFGDTSPEVDPSGESFTGKLIVKFNDPEMKSPCVRECVEVHENEHVRQLTPIIKKIHECDKAAGNDDEKKGECNVLATKLLNESRKSWECEAYRKSFTCLTLKILDSKGPCSKPPHKDEVQKHRGYEACEMKKYCNASDMPNV